MASDRLTLALMAHLRAINVIDDVDLSEIADSVDDGEDDGEFSIAHQVRCIAIVAAVKSVYPTQSDWEADKRRQRFVVVPKKGEDR